MLQSGAYPPTGPPGHAKAHRFHATIAGRVLILPSRPWRNSEARGAGQTVATADEQISIGLYTLEAYKYLHFGAAWSRNT
jgi:hypothetical protein